MTAFSFTIVDVFDLGDGYDGITLIGPAGEASGDLAIGDTLLVPTKLDHRASCECVQFPFVNLGRDRSGWVLVSVTGIATDEVQIGGCASRDS